ncbi:MAG: DUF4328 domain-containing protein [Akkermansiaceae bacterium]|nr:DUF4328 domain-containing protein [Akkermansiaceae bacterium]
MPDIHIAVPGEAQRTVSEGEAREISSRKGWPAGTLYWQGGMADWRPVTELSPAQAESQPNPYATPTVAETVAAPQSGVFAFVKDPRGITTVLIVLLGLSLLVDAIVMLLDFSQHVMLSRQFTEAEATANDSRQSMGGIAALIIYIATIICFCMWVHRANRNSRGFGAQGMQFTPGWAVGWYFIPFANLVKPCQSMAEIWKVSGDPIGWTHRKAGPVVGIWWTLWLLSNISSNISSRLGLAAETIDQIKTSTIASLISNGFGVASAVAAIILVLNVYRRQAALVSGSQATGDTV